VICLIGLLIIGVGIGGGIAQMWDSVAWLTFLGLGMCIASALTFLLVYRRASRALVEH
jgi:hypothetical protein